MPYHIIVQSNTSNTKKAIAPFGINFSSFISGFISLVLKMRGKIILANDDWAWWTLAQNMISIMLFTTNFLLRFFSYPPVFKVSLLRNMIQGYDISDFRKNVLNLIVLQVTSINRILVIIMLHKISIVFWNDYNHNPLCQLSCFAVNNKR